MGYTAAGEAITKNGPTTPAIPEDYAFQVTFFKLFEQLVAEGKLKPHPKTVGEKGLQGVLEG